MIEPLGLGNVSSFFSRLRLLEQIIGIALGPIHRKHKLAVVVSTAARLFDFETAVGASMEPQAGQPDIRQPLPDLAHRTNDLSQSNSVSKQLCNLASTSEVAKAEPAIPLIQQTELREFPYHVAR